MKVREMLTALRKDQLQRLCEIREKSVTGTVSGLLERLARSYRGNIETVVQDLRKEDLLAIGNWFDGQLELRPGWRQLPIEQMRRAFTEATTEIVQASSQSLEESLTLYSSQFNGSNTIARLDHTQLQRDVNRAKRVTVITAYYGERLLEELLVACRGRVRVVVNGLGGRRLEDQRKRLKQLTEHLRTKSNNVEIKLGFSEGIFHPKLYIFEHPSNSAVWIGSANATAAALRGHNEEILMRISSIPASVADYAKQVWKSAKPLEDCVVPVNSLIAFFRTGLLYYKPYALLPKTINPFRQMMLELPDDERKKLTKFESVFADPEAGIGAFNIDRVFEEQCEDDKTLGSGLGEGEKVLFRQYAVETTYGYWVSERFVDEVDCMLDRASTNKKRELERLRDWLLRSKDDIVEAYRQYLTDAKRTLEDEHVEYPSTYRYLFEDPEPGLKLIGTLTHLLTDERQFRRYHLEYVSSELPELWEDVLSREAFESSFFEWLAATSSRKRRPRSAATILDAIGARRGASAQEIRERLETRLADREGQWYEKVFLRED